MKKRLNLFAFIVFAGVVAWIFLLPAEAKRNIQRPILAFFGGINKATSAITTDDDVINGVNIAPEALVEKYTEEELAERYSLLLREVLELRVVKSQYAQIQRDNLKLHQALGFLQDYNSDTIKLIPARSIKRESATWWNDLWINKGSDHGFSRDSPVMTTTLANWEGRDVSPALVGKVIELVDRTARVLLLTDERCKVAARVEGGLESGLLMGDRTDGGAPILKLRYLSKSAEDVVPGLKVYSTDDGGVFPGNILLGTVTEFEQLEFYGEATVEPAVDFAQLTDVFVIVPKTEKEILDDAREADERAGRVTPPADYVPEPPVSSDVPPEARRALPVTGPDE